LITGRGPQDRDETLFDHRPFAVLADFLSNNGMVVLRVDDRGVGKSTGVFSDATTADFANDVSAGVDYLLKRPEVNKQKIGLIGHSEGGMIAPVVATLRKDIDFIVLLAGPGIKISDLLTEQNEAVYRSMKISEPAIKAYSSFYKKLMTETINTSDSTKVADKADKLIREFMINTDTSLLKELNFYSDKAKEQLLSNLLNSYSGKWIKYFVKFDPALSPKT
jgi:alpha/beta superfamily hydrolase